MSWYQDEVKETKALKQKTYYNASKKQREDIYVLRKKNIPIMLTITDMISEDDVETITSSLLSLEGITQVKPFLSRKKLKVYIDTSKTSLQMVSYTLSKLGYNYIKRG